MNLPALAPNIFSLATKELSQDSFFTWLLKWADQKYQFHDHALNLIGQNFVRLLINQDLEYKINRVEAGRQWKNIDIWAKVNDEYFIIIEDKTNTGAHSDQLERYKKIALDHYRDTDLKFIFI